MSVTLNDGQKYDIFNFLDEHTVEYGKVHSHTSMFNPKGAFFIKNDELDFFYQLYQKAIFDGIELHITERHEEISPIIIDLDLKYELETFERKHNETHIKKIIDLYITEIISIFNINIGDKRLSSFVFERDEIYKTKGITKDGIHIMFPYIISYPVAQYHIRDNILKKIGDVISDLGIKNLISDVVDRSIIAPNTCWLLYGSNKDKPKGNPYKLKYSFDGHGNVIDLESSEITDSNLPRFFSIRNKKESDLTLIRDDKLAILELTNKKKTVKLKQISSINYEPERIRELVSILGDDRAENYASWLEVGWALHNIDPNSQDLLNVWIDFSKRSVKFKDGECEKEWEKSKSEGLTLKSLHYWAKIDNYQKYQEYKNKDLNKWIDVSIKTQSNYDIAYVLFKMYEYDFVYSDNEWYIYKNHVWHREMDGMSLRQKISNELCAKYFKVISNYNTLAVSSDITEEEKEEYKKKGKEVLEIVKKLKTTAFKENVMKESKELFCDKDFMKKLDTNQYLIGFSNGVYDLKKGELRDGRPDDYIEMSTEIDKIEFDEHNEHWEDLKQFLNTVFFDEEIRTYFLTYFASCLQGHNAEEKFRIWTGVGSNGKSKILELFVHSLGMYSIKFPITMLTGKRAASNACTPEIVQSKGKRFGYFEEPSENERINAGLLKEFTGGDKIKARALHKEPIEFKPQFKLALLCNEMPEVPPNDTGTWRRMEVIEFKSRFCENPKESHEFAIDKHLSEKMRNWKELFMALLIDVYYAKYKTNGIKVPLEVIKFTLEYQKQCDLYTDFISENLDDTKENSDVIDISQLYDEFKVWYQDVFNNNKIPSKVEFKKYLKKKYTSKRLTTSEIKGFKFKLKQDKNASNGELNLMAGY